MRRWSAEHPAADQLYRRRAQRFAADWRRRGVRAEFLDSVHEHVVSALPQRGRDLDADQVARCVEPRVHHHAVPIVAFGRRLIGRCDDFCAHPAEPRHRHPLHFWSVTRIAGGRAELVPAARTPRSLRRSGRGFPRAARNRRPPARAASHARAPRPRLPSSSFGPAPRSPATAPPPNPSRGTRCNAAPRAGGRRRRR